MNPRLPATGGQTIGPFFGYGLPYDRDNELVPQSHPAALRLFGTVLDGDGEPIPDALVEIWQTDPSGEVVQQAGSLHRDGYTFTGWGRTATDPVGHYSFTTLLPGAAEPGTAAFFAITVFARGLLNRLFTRAYVPGDDAALASNALLSDLDSVHRKTLIACPDADGLRFDIHLQGENETVFLAYPGQ